MYDKINVERVLNSFLKYGAINSPPKNEQQMADEILPELIQLGFSVVQDDAGKKIGGNCNNIIASMKGSTAGIPIALSVHMDTVVPTDDWDYQINDGVISTSGKSILGADDKAGIAAVLEAIRVIKENSLPFADLQIIFSVAEEPGLLGALNMDMALISSDYVYVLDVGEPVGKIYLAAPTHTHFNAAFTGIGSHAGMCPENGVNAIVVAANAISRMNIGRIDGETTTNIGLIDGGNAVNAVAETCSIRGEVRSISDEKVETQLQYMQDCCEQAAREDGAAVDVNIDYLYRGYRFAPESPAVKLAARAVDLAGIPVMTGTTGGCSDANIFCANGIPAVPIGIGYKNAHSVRESIKVDDIVKTTAIVLGLISTAIDE